MFSFQVVLGQVKCEEDVYCDSIDNMGLVLVGNSGTEQNCKGLQGSFFLVKEQYQRAFLNFWKCKYCIGSTSWWFQNSGGTVIFKNNIYLTGDSQRIEIPNFQNLSPDTYQVQIEIPNQQNWEWTIVLRKSREVERRLSTKVPKGWKFSYSSYNNGFVLSKLDSVSYTNPYRIMAKKEQPLEHQTKLEYLFQISPSYQYNPEYQAKYRLEFWWDKPDKQSGLPIVKAKEDSTLQTLKSVFLNDSLYVSYLEYRNKLLENQFKPHVFLSENHNPSKLSIYMSNPNFWDMAESDKREIENLLSTVREILSAD